MTRARTTRRCRFSRGLSRWSFIRRRAERALVGSYFERLRVRAPGVDVVSRRALRRQSAEDRAREVAGRAVPDPDSRRADARRRRRREGGDPRADRRAGGARRRRAAHLERAAGGPQPLHPHPRPSRRPDRRRAPARRRNAGCVDAFDGGVWRDSQLPAPASTSSFQLRRMPDPGPRMPATRMFHFPSSNSVSAWKAVFAAGTPQ